jgi:hypothetical protein
MIYRRVVKCDVFKFHILPVSGINANYRYHQWAVDIKLRRNWIGEENRGSDLRVGESKRGKKEGFWKCR